MVRDGLDNKTASSIVDCLADIRSRTKDSMRMFVTLNDLQGQELREYERVAEQIFGKTSQISLETFIPRIINPSTKADLNALSLLKSGFVPVDPISENRVARRLRRQSVLIVPEYRALLEVISGNSDLQKAVSYFLTRKFNMRNSRVDPEANSLGMGFRVQRQACHTSSLIIGMIKSPRLDPLLQRALDRKAKTDTSAFKERYNLQTTAPLIELGIGTGGAMANYQTTRFMVAPKLMGVLSEKRGKYGGEFYLSPNPLWDLNSETRPLSLNARNSPGGGGTLNTVGPFAVVQQADVTRKGYGTQETLGKPIRANIATSISAIVNSDIINVFVNNDSAAAILPSYIRDNYPADTLIAEIRDPKTMQCYFAPAARIVSGAGLLTPREGLDMSDVDTARIILDESGKVAKGIDARIYNLDSFMEWCGDPAKEMSLEGIKEIIQLGGGDSHRIVTAYASGHGGESSKSTMQQVPIPEMTVYGAKYLDREEFLKKVGPDSTGARPLYHKIAIELPGRINGFQYSTSLSRSQAQRFEIDKETGRIAVYVRDPDNNEESKHVPKTDNYLYVNLTGYKINGLACFSSLQYKFYNTTEALNANSLVQVGTIIRYDPQSTSIMDTESRLDYAVISRIKSTRRSTTITLEQTSTEGVTAPITRKFNFTSQNRLSLELFSSANVIAVGEKVRSIPTDRLVYSHISGMPGEEISQLIPIARQVDGREIYMIGVGARLPLSATIRALIRELEISENTVSYWANQRQVTLFGIYTAQKDIKTPPLSYSTGFFADQSKSKTIELPNPTLSKKEIERTFRFNPAVLAEKIPLDLATDDLLKLGASIALESFRTDKKCPIKKLTFKVQRSPDTDETSYIVTLPKDSPKKGAWDAVTNLLMNDPDVQRAIHARCQPIVIGSRGMTINNNTSIKIKIPISNGKIRPGRLTIEENDH